MKPVLELLLITCIALSVNFLLLAYIVITVVLHCICYIFVDFFGLQSS
jgi:hypothetical protein